MKKLKAFATILLSLIIVSILSPTLTAKGSIVPEGDIRKMVTSLNLPDVAVLDGQTTELSTSNLKTLFVDGLWFAGQKQDSTLIQEMKNVVLNHVPVIIVGGDASLIYDIADARIKENSSLTPQAQAVYFDGTKNCYLCVAGRPETASAVQDAYNWTIAKLQAKSPQDLPPPPLPQGVASAQAMAADPPTAVWISIAQFTWDNDSAPYGNLHVVEEWYKLQYDQSSTYDWYSLVMDTTSMPGKYVYGSDWRTARIWDLANVTYYGYPNKIIKEGPTTTTGSSTFSVNIGVTAGTGGSSVTAGFSYSYTISDVQAYDGSLPDQGLAYWYHTVNPQSASGMADCTVYPGLTFRTPPTGAGPGGQASVKILEAYQVQYAAWDFWWGFYPPDYSPLQNIAIATTINYNWNPDTPLTPTGGPGATQGVKGQWYQFSTSANDPDGNNVGYWFDWGDQTQTFSGWVQSGYTGFASHAWSHGGVYPVKVYAVESLTYLQSSWSMILPVTIEPTLTISASSGGLNPPTNPSPGTYTESYGSSVTVTAYPAAGYYFNHWSLDGNTYSTYPTTAVTMAADHSLMAYFSPNPTLTISVSGSGSTNPLPGTYSCTYGSSVTVTETPLNGYAFDFWLLDSTTYYYTTSVTVTMWASHSLTAYFYYPSGGGCPYIAAWNGTGYKLDNNILPDSKMSAGHDVKDYYKIQQQLVPTLTSNKFSSYSLKIQEFEHEHDYIDQVRLLAVDHPDGVNVAVSPTGEILTYKHPASPISATSNDGTDVLQLLKTADGNYYQGYNGSYITVTFAAADVSSGAKLVIVDSDMFYKESPIYVQVLNADGQWNTVAVFHTRINWVTDIINMTGYLPDAQGNLKVRLCFVSKDEVDYIGLDTTPQANVQVHDAKLLNALSSSQGDVTNLLKADDEKYAELVPGQQIRLTFQLPTNQNGQRTFIFYAEGHYETIP